MTPFNDLHNNFNNIRLRHPISVHSVEYKTDELTGKLFEKKKLVVLCNAEITTLAAKKNRNTLNSEMG